MSFHEYAEVLRNTKYRQIRSTLTNFKDGRCAVGVLAEYMQADHRFAYSMVANRLGYEHLARLLDWNNEGLTFDQIADKLDEME